MLQKLLIWVSTHLNLKNFSHISAILSTFPRCIINKIIIKNKHPIRWIFSFCAFCVINCFKIADILYISELSWRRCLRCWIALTSENICRWLFTLWHQLSTTHQICKHKLWPHCAQPLSSSVLGTYFSLFKCFVLIGKPLVKLTVTTSTEVISDFLNAMEVSFNSQPNILKDWFCLILDVF